MDNALNNRQVEGRVNRVTFNIPTFNPIDISVEDVRIMMDEAERSRMLQYNVNDLQFLNYNHINSIRAINTNLIDAMDQEIARNVETSNHNLDRQDTLNQCYARVNNMYSDVHRGITIEHKVENKTTEVIDSNKPEFGETEGYIVNEMGDNYLHVYFDNNFYKDRFIKSLSKYKLKLDSKESSYHYCFYFEDEILATDNEIVVKWMEEIKLKKASEKFIKLVQTKY